METWGLDSSGLGQGLAVGSCEHGNERFSSVECWECLFSGFLCLWILPVVYYSKRQFRKVDLFPLSGERVEWHLVIVARYVELIYSSASPQFHQRMEADPVSEI
jgi:hypothetical protein